MPYVLRKVTGGWKVFKQGTTKAMSKRPLTKDDAEAQMRALYANDPNAHRESDRRS